jgi:hypothetical protein
MRLVEVDLFLEGKAFTPILSVCEQRVSKLSFKGIHFLQKSSRLQFIFLPLLMLVPQSRNMIH